MRILFVTQIVPYPPHGGVLQRGFNLVRELGLAHEVRLLAFHHPDELPPGDPLDRSRKELGAYCRQVEYFDLWPKRSQAHKFIGLALAAFHPEPFSVLAQRNRRLSRRISDLCRSAQPPDIVHLDTVALAPYAADCGLVPSVLTHHNIESQLMQRRAEFERGPLNRRYVLLQASRLRRYESAVCGRFPLNVTVSQADADLLAQICPGVRTEVVPNGVDTEYFRPAWGQESAAVVFTGGMNMFANRDAVEWFLEAVWPLVKARRPDAKFFAIGQRPSQKLLEATRLDPSVIAPGHVADVRPWVQRAAVYIVPMRVGGGTRLKVVDAMAQGKAIVSTTLGTEGIEGTPGVHFLNADEPRTFADNVIRLIEQPAQRRSLGAAARSRAESHYAWPIQGQRLIAAYQRVLAEHCR